MDVHPTPIAGSRGLFWILAPLALALAVWLPWAAWAEGARGLRLTVGFMCGLFGVCTALCLHNPRRFRWAGCLMALMLIALVGGYDLTLLQQWGQGGVVVGPRDYLQIAFVHLVLGWPSVVYLINTNRRHVWR